MEVYRNPKSPFWFYDVMIDGVRRRGSTKLLASGPKAVSKRAAEREADKLVAGLQVEVRTKSITLRECLDLYCARLQRERKASWRNQVALKDKLLGLTDKWSITGDTLIHTLTPMHMERLVRARTQEGNSPQTICHEIKMVRAAVRDAAGLGYDSPAAMVRGNVKNPWRMPQVAQKTRYLSWEEFETLYAAMDPAREITTSRTSVPYQLEGRSREEAQDAQDLLVALVMTGGRWSEVAALTWDRVDIDTKTVRLFGTKDGEERLVPMPDQFHEVLKRRHAVAHGSLVFPSRKFNDERQRAGSCQAIIKAMSDIGLNRDDNLVRYGRATVHSLRHTFASWCLQSGADLAEVQSALGHASLQMTLRYAHQAKAKTATKLGGILTSIGASKCSNAR